MSHEVCGNVVRECESPLASDKTNKHHFLKPLVGYPSCQAYTQPPSAQSAVFWARCHFEQNQLSSKQIQAVEDGVLVGHRNCMHRNELLIQTNSLSFSGEGIESRRQG